MTTLGRGCVELLWGAALLATLVARPIRAQDAERAASDGAAAQTGGATRDANSAAPGGALAEIVVTAQRRTDTAQRTSLSLQVLGTQQLENAGVTQAVDLTTLVPGLQIAHAGASTQVYIRGVGNFGSTSIANPAVAFNVDGVYVGRNEAFAGVFYDVARIEVLKGPQGTLYGRNAAGGAINLITNRPSFDRFGGELGIEGGNFDLVNTQGAINVPLGDRFAVRGAFQVVDRDGYTSTRQDDDVHESFRLQAMWEPSDALSIRLSGDYTHLGGKGAAFVLHPPLPGTSPWTDVSDPAFNAYSIPITDANIFPGAVAPADASRVRQDIYLRNVGAELNYDLGFATLTVLPAYRYTSSSYLSYIANFYYDNSGGAGSRAAHPETAKQTSGEVRLANTSDNLKWVLGAYYYKEDTETQFQIFTGLLQNTLVASDFNTRSYAGFGEATLNLTDRLRLIAGARYTTDRRTLDDGQADAIFPVVPNCLNPAVPLCLLETFTGRKTFEKFTWKGGFEFDIAPQNMLFATAATGFKAGGFNQAAELIPGSTNALPFDPEVLTAYTIGLRNRFLDNRLQANLEAFYYDYQDHQEPSVNVDGQGVIALIFQNAGKARQYGADLDIVYKPFADTTLSGNVEYLDSKYIEFVYEALGALIIPGVSTACSVAPAAPPRVTVDCSGFQLTRAPTWSGTAGLAQQFHLPGDSTLEAAVNASFASSRWLAPDFIPNERAGSYTTINASVTFERYIGDHRRIALTGFVRNLTNEKIYTGATKSPFIPTVVAATIGAPRTYGARLDVSF